MQKSSKLSKSSFSADIYRRYNMDLRGLSDEELANHFRVSQHEPRVFARTDSTRQYMSIAWLRGRGVEIGPGDNPTPVFGDASLEYVDIDTEGVFGKQSSFIDFDIQSEELPDEMRGHYDFLIASHVLEHCDSLLRGLKNCADMLKTSRGTLYLILPDIRYLEDNFWLPNFDFEHHISEFSDQYCYREKHDRAFLNYSYSKEEGVISSNFKIPKELSEIRKDKHLIPLEYRFITHKHNYSFSQWLSCLQQGFAWLGIDAVVQDAMFDRARNDCHYVFILNDVPA